MCPLPPLLGTFEGAGPPSRVRRGGQSAPFHDEPYGGEAVRRRRGGEEAGPEHHHHGRERRREDGGRQVSLSFFYVHCLLGLLIFTLHHQRGMCWGRWGGGSGRACCSFDLDHGRWFSMSCAKTDTEHDEFSPVRIFRVGKGREMARGRVLQKTNWGKVATRRGSRRSADSHELVLLDGFSLIVVLQPSRVPPAPPPRVHAADCERQRGI